MGMRLDEAIKRYKNNAEYERAHGLQDCLEFRQLAKWLEELRAYRNMYHADNVDNCLREKVVDNGMSIDEVIKEIELEFNTFLSETGMNTPDAIKHEQSTNVDFDKVYTANKMAIDILYKYQKIRQILKVWKDTGYINSFDSMVEIREVLEDGQDTIKN